MLHLAILLEENMKRLRVALLFLVGLVMGSCASPMNNLTANAQYFPVRRDIRYPITVIAETKLEDDNGRLHMKVVEIDGCEFVISYNDYAGGSMTMQPLRLCQAKKVE